MRTLVVVSLLFLVSCSSPNNSVLEEPTIEYFSSTCYGSCPSYRIQVYESGNVVFTPYRYTAVTDVRTRSIAKSEVRTLQQMAEAVKFFDYADEYVYDTIPGVGAVTHSDGQGITLSIAHAGKSKSIYMYLGEPRALVDLREEVVSATIPASWIGE